MNWNKKYCNKIWKYYRREKLHDKDISFLMMQTNMKDNTKIDYKKEKELILRR